MKSIFKRILNISAILCTLLLVICSIFAVVAIVKCDKIDLTKIDEIKSTTIFDNDGNKILESGSKLASYVSYFDISQSMIDALIAVEDREFYSHNGINTKRMLSALISNIQNLGFSQGASTINQQLIKNIFLSSDKTLTRKIQEIHLALRLDKLLTKNQIIEAYLNNVLFGGNIYGVEMASYYYFRKKAVELNPGEAATLAGLIQLPNYFNPFKNPKACQERRNTVLALMYEEKYLTANELDYYKSLSITDILNKGTIYSENNYASSYIDYVLEEYHGLGIETPSSIYINTYMDQSLQHDFYKIVNNDYGFLPDNDIHCALVAIDNATGGLKAIVGNKSTDRMVLNYATSLIQPGSTIKPILDYAPAIEFLNYSPATIILDEPYKYQNNQELKNWDNQYKGYITLRKALAESRNIPAVKIFNQLGMNKALEFADRININPKPPVYESEAIGGSTYGYSLVNLTNAYTAFANMGKFSPLSSISSASSGIDEYNREVNFKTVMKPSTAYLINSMLHDVFAGSSFDLNFSYLCAKTGQTNYDSKTLEQYNIPYGSTKDSLLIAYTKDLTIGIWISYDKLSSTTYLTQSKVNVARSIMKFIMQRYAKPNQFYDIPSNIVACQIIKDYNSIYLADENTPNSYTEYFIKGTEPLNKKNDIPYYSA